MSHSNDTHERTLTNYSIKMLLSAKFDDKKQHFIIDNEPVLGLLCVLGKIDTINVKHNHIQIILYESNAKIKCFLWNKFDTMQNNKQFKFGNVILYNEV